MVALESKNSDVKNVEAVSKSQSGQLIIIGGAEDKEGECKILREFIRRAGGRNARIVVMTVATSLPGEVGSDYRYLFESWVQRQLRLSIPNAEKMLVMNEI